MAKWLHKMKQIGLKYRLTVLALITISLFPITLCTFCFGRKAEGEKDASSSETSGRLIPISQLRIPVELAEKVEIKSQAFLKFFKTPKVQFMPLGFYAMVENMRDVEKLSHLRKHGINLFHKYNSRQDINDALADLESAGKAGVGVLQNLPRAFFVSGSLSFWQNHISALAGNDQILVWYLPEETKAEDIDKLEQIGNIIRAMDGRKRPVITYASDSDGEYLKRLGRIVDAVVFGAYPSLYMPRPRVDIKRRIEKAYESGVPIVIVALEALKGRRNWTRRKDVRFDAYLALISGAKGIMWYGYYHAEPRPELLEAVLEVATELNGPEHLGEVFLLGKEPKLLSCQLLKGPRLSPPASAYEKGWESKGVFKRYDSIQWTTREHEKYLYIFAVNAAQKVERLKAVDDGGAAYRVEVKFGPIGSSSGVVRVISEGRTIDLSGGYFVDSFEPLGTHIYKVSLN